MQLFSELSDVHDNLSKVAKSISKLGWITSPEQFSFILKLAVRPLIQLKIPPHLCSPGDLWFAKEQLTKEECFEEMYVNEILPKPYHKKLTAVPLKHTTHCLVAATHYLLRKKMFDTKISQAEFAKEFAVSEKKLHLAISGRKYDPGKEVPERKSSDKLPAKVKANKTNAPKIDKVTKTQEAVELPEQDLGESEYGDTDKDNDDPDLFTPQGPEKSKNSDTKEDPPEEEVESTEPIDVDADIPELISDDGEEEARPKQFTFKKPKGPRPCHK